MVRPVLLGNAQLFHGWAEELFERQRGRRKANQAVSYEPVTSFISMLRHLGGIGVFILAALDSSVMPTLGAVDAGIAPYPAPIRAGRPSSGGPYQ